MTVMSTACCAGLVVTVMSHSKSGIIVPMIQWGSLCLDSARLRELLMITVSNSPRHRPHHRDGDHDHATAPTQTDLADLKMGGIQFTAAVHALNVVAARSLTHYQSQT